MPKAFEAALNFGLSITGTRAYANGRVVDYSDQQALGARFLETASKEGTTSARAPSARIATVEVLTAPTELGAARAGGPNSLTARSPWHWQLYFGLSR